MQGRFIADVSRDLARWWLLSRATVFVTALAVGATGWPHEVSDHGLGLLTGWDGAWYREIASNGYYPQSSSGLSDVAFFPLLPAIMAALALVHVPLAVTGVVVANAFSAAAVFGVYFLCRPWCTEPIARRAAIYTAIFPFSFVFSMAYPESIALAGTVLAAVAARKARWTLAAVSAAAAALARPQAALIVLPLAAFALERKPRSRRLPAAAVAAVLAPVAAVVGFWLYLWVTLKDPHAWSRAEAGWGRSSSLAGPFDAVRQFVSGPWTDFSTSPYSVLWGVRDAVFTLAYAIMVVLASKAQVPRIWIAYGLLVLAIPLFSGTFTAMAREGVLAFPFVVGLAWIGRRPLLDLAIRIGSIACLSAFVVSLAYHFP